MTLLGGGVSRHDTSQGQKQSFFGSLFYFWHKKQSFFIVPKCTDTHPPLTWSFDLHLIIQRHIQQNVAWLRFYTDKHNEEFCQHLQLMITEVETQFLHFFTFLGTIQKSVTVLETIHRCLCQTDGLHAHSTCRETTIINYNN